MSFVKPVGKGSYGCLILKDRMFISIQNNNQMENLLLSVGFIFFF